MQSSFAARSNCTSQQHVWQPSIEYSARRDYCRLSLVQDTTPMSFIDVIEQWQTNSEFRALYIKLVSDLPWPAVFWETPGLTRITLQEPYECVFVNAPALAGVAADRQTFASHFQAHPNNAVITFDNLGRDAELVVPCPQDSNSRYSHLVQFFRQGPPAQCEALLQCLGERIEKNIGERSLWISTSGLGVYWLHVRLDAQPKYYTHTAYINRQ